MRGWMNLSISKRVYLNRLAGCAGELAGVERIIYRCAKTVGLPVMPRKAAKYSVCWEYLRTAASGRIILRISRALNSHGQARYVWCVDAGVLHVRQHWICAITRILMKQISDDNTAGNTVVCGASTARFRAKVARRFGESKNCVKMKAAT